MKKRSKSLKRSRKNPKKKLTSNKKRISINKMHKIQHFSNKKHHKIRLLIQNKQHDNQPRKSFLTILKQLFKAEKTLIKKIKHEERKIPKSHLLYVLISLIGTGILIASIVKQNESLLFLGSNIAIITACISGIIAIRKIKSSKTIKPKKKERKILKVLLIFLTSPIPYSLVSISILVYSFIKHIRTLFWIGFGLLILSILLLFTKKIKHKNLRLINFKEEINVKHEKYETDLDKLYRVLQKHKMIKFSDISKTFNIDMQKVEEWAKIMEDNELAEIHYPAIGEPELSIRSATIIEEQQ